MLRKTTLSLIAAMTVTGYASAASVAFDSLTRLTTNATTFNLSVVDGSASYQANADTGDTSIKTLGDGTLLDYKLLGGSNLNGQVFNSNNVGYANGAANYINNPTSFSVLDGTTPALIYTPSNWGQVWHTTAPVNFTTTADQTTFTVLNAGGSASPMGPISGTVDISTILSGEFFIFGGGYQANTDYTIVLSGTGQPDLTATHKDVINVNNNRVNVVVFDFDNTGLLYDTLTWTYDHNSTNSRGRFMGVAIDGTVVPEPSSLALLGLGGLMLVRRRKA